jgi:membrane dipeptidase
MNRLGMMVDLSHVSHEAMHAVLNLTSAPVIFSHSSAYSLCNNPRNVPDSVLARLKDTGGVVMVNFYPAFISCGSNATLKDVADHIEHIARVAGHDHVGIGSDFDGINSVPIGLEDVSKVCLN